MNLIGVGRGTAAATLTVLLCALAVPAFAEEEPGHEAAAEGEAVIAVASDASSRATVHIGGFIAAAACVGVSVIGAAWAVAKVGTAAMGAVAEKPELMGRSMVYVGLAEGLAIYGLIIAILILEKL